ncbi:hypothetical protein FC19_GL001368 [Liquorilactobacillus aquaticus DSM 21051]|uniref:Uncharacterized protein n=1 Tax=Liquorilactobacillus aquaticus DSM 21051 TaxID=1423725 RepID=A0A0R2CVK5_9LACO|nr:hypothetical protein FC19_GL001368 [Liquorilactobacillus aquaticus DSM 21051]
MLKKYLGIQKTLIDKAYYKKTIHVSKGAGSYVPKLESYIRKSNDFSIVIYKNT